MPQRIHIQIHKSKQQSNILVSKASITPPTILNHNLGLKNYELSNHLGNVCAVISDRKIPRSSNGTTIAYYMPDIVSATDYYPFGMTMQERTFSAGVEAYRYGFNGKENDNESNTQDYGMRIYDGRLGRFLSVDPLTKYFAFYTPYQFSGNTPISATDLDGLEEIYFMESIVRSFGHISFQKLTATKLGRQTISAFQNTNPNIGPVNKGFDAYIIHGGIFTRQNGHTQIWRISSAQYQIRVDGVFYSYKEAIMAARANPNGAVMKALNTEIPKEIILGSAIIETLEKHRDIIVITINSMTNDKDGKYNTEDFESVNDIATTAGHEFESHGNRIASGDECSEFDEHYMTEGNYGKGTANVYNKDECHLAKYSCQLKNELENLPDENCSDNNK